MSKFHKTLKNEFEIGATHSLKGTCYDSSSKRYESAISGHTPQVNLTLFQIPNPIEATYIGFEKGHLKFQQTNNKSLPEFISIYGSQIRDNKVTISKILNGQTIQFTTNGWKEINDATN